MQIGEHHNKITVGLATRKHDINTVCGSDESSWGFNISEGKLFHNNDANVTYGRRVHEGEHITILLDRDSGTMELQISEEEVLGVAFHDEKLKKLWLHPCLSTEVKFSARFVEGYPV